MTESIQLQAASLFVRDVIEALGRPQPPLDSTVDLSTLRFDVVGQLEEMKATIERLTAENQRLKALEQLVLELKAHSSEHGWQDVDDPIVALLEWVPERLKGRAE